jgi:hypothetical protein
MSSGERGVIDFPLSKKIAGQKMLALDKALNISGELIELALQGDWSLIADMQSERESLLQGALDGEVPEPLKAEAALKLKQLIAMNEHLTKVVIGAKADLVRQFNAERAQTRAARHYLR